MTDDKKQKSFQQVNVRAIVLDILIETQKLDNMSHVVFGNALKKYQYLDKRERSFITKLSQGTIEKRIYLDYCIEQFSKTPMKKIKPLIKNLLEMSVYQLLYMDSVPVSAVCNEAVKLAEKRGFKTLKGYVNGVLRNIARAIDTIELPIKEENTIFYYSIKYSLPEWLVKMWITQYGEVLFEDIAKSLYEPRKIFIRCNTKKVTPNELKSHLEQEGVAVKSVEGLDYAFEIENYDYLSSLQALCNGEFYIQDSSSMLASEGNIIKKDAYIIDVCAAPGGKSMNAALKAIDGYVEARDLNSYKVGLIEENISHLGLSNICAKMWDATILDKDAIEKADVVIADLPCSGLGIIGRKPDIKDKMNPEKIDALVQLQRKILSTVTSYVKPNGVLIYSTCTINKCENDDNVSWFMKNYSYQLIEPAIQIFPQHAAGHIQGGDGFYIARLQKRNGFTNN
ncbi:MAG: 16S rRNA (cytosine(967)-C(5))-methyltransferase RsmB [Lachnospira sp.]|nr:16S rRNA (cytosine(967)-C(5))-methyltransferase RsmB [Lachnospira sp.]